MTIVAVEQFMPASQRIVNDELAAQFLPRSTQLAIAPCRWTFLRRQLLRLSERRFPGLWGSLLCRKRYGDDQFSEAVRSGIGQVVVLGAGLDDRPYRELASPTPMTFELDLPANSTYKQRRLESIFGRIPAHARLISTDFENDDPAELLRQHGFQADVPAFFVWEAVTQYLTEAAVRRTFAFLARAAAGSRIVFTYVQQDFLNGAARETCPALWDQFLGKEPLWHFGLRPAAVAAFLDQYGWSAGDDVGAAEYRRRYCEPRGRRLDVADVERFVAADKR